MGGRAARELGTTDRGSLAYPGGRPRRVNGPTGGLFRPPLEPVTARILHALPTAVRGSALDAWAARGSGLVPFGSRGVWCCAGRRYLPHAHGGESSGPAWRWLHQCDAAQSAISSAEGPTRAKICRARLLEPRGALPP